MRRLYVFSAATQSRSLNSVLAAPALAFLLILPIGAQRRSLIRLNSTMAVVVVAVVLQGCNGGFALPQAATVSSHART